MSKRRRRGCGNGSRRRRGLPDVRRIIRSPEAQSDVDDIALHIARDNLDAALRWLDSVDACLKMLARHPGAGPARDELAAGLRSFPLGNYLILYRVTAAA